MTDSERRFYVLAKLAELRFQAASTDLLGLKYGIVEHKGDIV